MTARTETMRDRWHRQPTWLRWTVGLVAAAVVWGLLQWWQTSRDGYGRTWILLAVAAVLLPIAFLQAGHRLGGRGQSRLLRRSMREGRVLEGANLERWRIEVPRRARYLREYRVFSAIAFWISLVLLVVAVAIMFAVTSPGVATLVSAVLVAVGVVNALLIFVWLPRQRRQLGVLEQELTSAADGG